MALSLLPDNFRDFIQCLNDNHVDYILIGGYALGIYDVISKHDFITNKIASGRTHDVRDARNLQSNFASPSGNNIINCLKYESFFVPNRAFFDNLGIQQEETYNNNLSKYIKPGNKPLYYLCRSLPENKIELFQMDRNFDQNTANFFVADWDARRLSYNNIKHLSSKKKKKHR